MLRYAWYTSNCCRTCEFWQLSSQQIDTRLVGGMDALPGIAGCFKGRLSCLGFIRCSENDVI